MKRLAIALMVVMLFGCGAIKNNVKTWDRYDTAYQATALAITGVDLVQTHTIAKNDWYENGHYHSEVNPLFFNDKPHQDAVDIIILGGMVVHTLIAMALPPKVKIFDFTINPRRIWQALFIGIEIGAAWNNTIHSKD
jgi:hypothetical protein